MKSKAAQPLCLLLLATPLALQQLAISRAISRNESLQAAYVSSESLARTSARNAVPRTISTGKKRITIDMLQRAYMEAQSSLLKNIEYQKMFASLDSTDFTNLIPATSTLPDSQQDQINLLRQLVEALSISDPGLAVRLAVGAYPKRPYILSAGIEQAIFRWASTELDQATEWLIELHKSHSGTDRSKFMNYQAAVAASLILSGSPRTREVITMSSDVRPDYVIRDAIGFLHQRKPEAEDAAYIVDAFSKFLPWIREFVAEDMSKTSSAMDQRAAFHSFLSNTDSLRSPVGSSITGKILKSLDLTPVEQRMIAEIQAEQILRTPYNTHPIPDRVKFEAAAREWLQTYVPDEAEEIFMKSKSIVVDGGRWQIQRTLKDLAARQVIRDSDILQELDGLDLSEFSELLPQALEQAKRIKDPSKRAETTLRLEATGKSSHPNP